MARLRIQDVCEALDSDLRRALATAVRKTIPNAEFSEHALFREFMREVGHRCSTWEQVPDQYVELQ